VLGRFRLPMVPALCVFGGAGIDLLVTLAEKRDWRRLAAASALVIAIAIAAWPRPPDPLRPADYYNLVRYHVLRREPAQAFAWVQRGRQSLEAHAGMLDSDALGYSRAWYMFIAGDPLDRVAAEVAPALQSRSPSLSMSARGLDGEITRRHQDGDPRPLGFRFMP